MLIRGRHFVKSKINGELGMTNDVSKLAAFTGYYSMKGATGVAPGAFLSVDTTEQHSPQATNIVINASMDGKSPLGPYAFGKGDSFDGTTLNMPAAKLTLKFTRQYQDGRVVTFSGTVGGVNVNGGTYFNPAPLSAFIGDYYDPATKKKTLSITSTEILFDFSALSKAPSGWLTAVSIYSYVPAMFVLTFSGPAGSNPPKFMLMLGTASQYGLACSVQDGDTPPKFAPKMLLSIV